MFRQPSLLQLLPGDDVGGGVLLAVADLVLLLVRLGAGVELAEAFGLHFPLTATGGELLLCRQEMKIDVKSYSWENNRLVKKLP